MEWGWQQWEEKYSPKVHMPHAVLRARETTKEKHKPSKAYKVRVKAPWKGRGEDAGRALSGTRPQSDSEETFRVKAANTEPALVNTTVG